MSHISTAALQSLVAPALLAQMPTPRITSPNPLSINQLNTFAENHQDQNAPQYHLMVFRAENGQLYGVVARMSSPATRAHSGSGGLTTGLTRVNFNDRVTDPVLFSQLIGQHAAALGIANPNQVRMFNGNSLPFSTDNARWNSGNATAVYTGGVMHRPSFGAPLETVHIRGANSGILFLGNVTVPPVTGLAVNNTAMTIGTATRWQAAGLNTDNARLQFGVAGQTTFPGSFSLMTPQMRTDGVTAVTQVQMQTPRNTLHNGTLQTIVPFRVTYTSPTATRTTTDNESYLIVSPNGYVTGIHYMGQNYPGPVIPASTSLAVVPNLRGSTALSSSNNPSGLVYSRLSLSFGPGAGQEFPVPNTTTGAAEGVTLREVTLQEGNRIHHITVTYTGAQAPQFGQVVQAPDGSILSVTIGEERYNATRIGSTTAQAGTMRHQAGLQVPTDVARLIEANRQLQITGGGAEFGIWRPIGLWRDLRSGNLNIPQDTPMFMMVHEGSGATPDERRASSRVSLGFYPNPVSSSNMVQIISPGYMPNDVEVIEQNGPSGRPVRVPIQGWYQIGTHSGSRAAGFTQVPQPGGIVFNSVNLGGVRATVRPGGSLTQGEVSSHAIQYGPNPDQVFQLLNVRHSNTGTQVGPIQWVGNFRRVQINTTGTPSSRTVIRFTVASGPQGNPNVFEEGEFTLNPSGVVTGATFRGHTYDTPARLNGAREADTPRGAPPTVNVANLVTANGNNLVFPGPPPRSITITPPPNAANATGASATPILNISNFRPVWENGQMSIRFTVYSRRHHLASSATVASQWNYGDFIQEEGRVELNPGGTAAVAVILNRGGTDRRVQLDRIGLDLAVPANQTAFAASQLQTWYLFHGNNPIDGTWRPVDLRAAGATIAFNGSATEVPLPANTYFHNLRDAGTTVTYRILPDGRVVLRTTVGAVNRYLISYTDPNERPVAGGAPWSIWQPATAGNPDTGVTFSAIFPSTSYTSLIPRLP